MRLRDLGGVIVNDFIDMRKERHRRGVERALRDAVRRDRARTKILRTSPFGLIEMTRQRIRPSLKRSAYKDCPCCHGTGGGEDAREHGHRGRAAVDRDRPEAGDRRRSRVTVAADVADYLNNRKRHDLARLEDEGSMTVQIVGDEHAGPEHLRFRVLGRRRPGREVPLSVGHIPSACSGEGPGRLTPLARTRERGRG